MSPDERFWASVDASGDCWLWTAGKNGHGYGVTYASGRPGVVSHRWAYESLVGPIPPGLELDHLCRVKACVNPDHLEPVTHRVNTLRGPGPTARYASRTHCIAGHPFDSINTHICYTPEGTPWRKCRACDRISHRKRDARRRQAA